MAKSFDIVFCKKKTDRCLRARGRRVAIPTHRVQEGCVQCKCQTWVNICFLSFSCRPSFIFSYGVAKKRRFHADYIFSGYPCQSEAFCLWEFRLSLYSFSFSARRAAMSAYVCLRLPPQSCSFNFFFSCFSITQRFPR